MSGSAGHRVFTMTVASVYPLYLAKVEKKGRTRDELAKGRALEKVLRA
jgi:hypothetical protein